METDSEAVELVDAEFVRPFARAALLAALTGAFAYVSFPLPLSPVPVTLQVFGVFLAGLYLGPKWGAVSMVLYLAAGAVGAPIFSGGTAGIGVLLAERGGYLWAFPLAAFLIGLVVHRGVRIRNPADASVPLVVAALLAGAVLIYALGVAWLSWVLAIGVVEAIAIGALPFVPGELFKIAAAIAIVKSGAIDPT